MFSLFSIISIFVPLQFDPYITELPKLSLQNVTNLSSENGNTYVFALAPNLNHRFMVEIWRTFNQVAFAYKDKALFYIFDDQTAISLSRDEDGSIIRIPAIFIFKNGEKVGCLPCETSEPLLLLSFHSLLSNDIISDVDTLFSSIGNTKLAILTPPNLFQSSVSLYLNLSLYLLKTLWIESYKPKQIQDVMIVQVSPEVLSSLNYSISSLSLFRNIDKTIISFESTLSDFLDSTRPYFSIFDHSLDPGEYTLFALTADNFTDEMKDFLYDIGKSQPNFTVGYLPNAGLGIGEDIFGKRFEPGLGIHVFSPFLRFQYITHDVFTPEFLQKPFNSTEWKQKCEKFFSMIESGKRKKSYISEPIPRKSSTYIKKVVGKTYEEFVTDPNHDIIMLYKRTNCSYCQDFLGVYEDFAVECEEKNLTEVLFGMIDVTKNSAEMPYPFFASLPHVEIFPAHNKSNHQMLRGGKSKDAMARMLKRYSSLIKETKEKPFPFKFIEKDNITIKMELSREIMQQPALPPEEDAKFRAYIEAIIKENNITMELPWIKPKTFSANPKFDEL